MLGCALVKFDKNESVILGVPNELVKYQVQLKTKDHTNLIGDFTRQYKGFFVATFEEILLLNSKQMANTTMLIDELHEFIAKDKSGFFITRSRKFVGLTATIGFTRSMQFKDKFKDGHLMLWSSNQEEEQNLEKLKLDGYKLPKQKTMDEKQNFWKQVVESRL